MSLGGALRDAIVWHRRCADIIDSIGYVYGGQATRTGLGPPNTYVLTTGVPVVAFIQGERFRFTPDAVNNGSATLQIDNMAPKSILRYAGGALQANDLMQSVPIEVEYSLALDAFILQYFPTRDGDYANLTTQAASGTFTPVTTHYAKYQQTGKWVTTIASFTGTTSATPAYISFNLPVASASLGSAQAVMGICQDGGNDIPAIFQIQDNSFQCRVYKSDLTNFGAGAGRGAYCNFSYLAA